jgi:hypothetical protein
VWNGIKSGADEFFMPYDITDECLEKMSSAEMEAEFGITRRQTRSHRIVSVKKRPFVIESNFLRPVLFRLTNLSRLTVNATELSRVLVQIDSPKHALANTHAVSYIRFGERQSFHRREDCRRREPWYAVPVASPGPIVWSISQQYRHLIGWNADNIVANHNFFYLESNNGADQLLCAILNSTVVGLFKEFYGRPAGREGAIKTEGMDIRRTLIPDPRLASGDIKTRIVKGFERLLRRPYPSGQWLSDQFTWPERCDLDSAVLELIGFIDPNVRSETQKELYGAIERIYRARRDVELKAQRNRGERGRKGRPTARSLAEELWLRLPKNDYRPFPEGFIEPGTETELIQLDGKVVVGTHLMTHGSLIAQGCVRIGNKIIDLGADSRAVLLGRAAQTLAGEAVAVPVDQESCARILADHDAYIESQRALLREKAADITADENLQREIVENLIERIFHVR